MKTRLEILKEYYSDVQDIEQRVNDSFYISVMNSNDNLIDSLYFHADDYIELLIENGYTDISIDEAQIEIESFLETNIL